MLRIVWTLGVQAAIIVLPTIGKDLSIPDSRQQWIISAYSLTFGCFLVRAYSKTVCQLVLTLYSYSGEDWQMYMGSALYSYGALLGLPQPQLLFRL